MSLHPLLLRGMYAFGFASPSAVQMRAIVPLVEGRDLVAQSQSGTGKTGVFSIGAISVVDTKSATTQVFIVSPTRELATHSASVVLGLARYLPDLQCRPLVCGTTSVTQDVAALNLYAPHVVSATPGRLLALVRSGALSTKHVKLLVVDEADEMFRFDLEKQIVDVHGLLAQNVQVVLMSATLPQEVLRVLKRIASNPLLVKVRDKEVSLAAIKQYIVDVKDEKWKLDALVDLYDVLTVRQSIVFCNEKIKAQWVADALKKKKFDVAVVHSDLPQAKRESVLAKFRAGAHRVLVATDVFARGIDVQQVNLVLNYDLPTDLEFYVHRVGRTGRFGKKGVAVSLIVDGEAKKVSELRATYGVVVGPLPSDVRKVYE